MITSDSRSVYPITYTQAECEKIKGRKDFAELFMRAFGEDIVKQWKCSYERHNNGGILYHLDIKLKRVLHGKW